MRERDPGGLSRLSIVQQPYLEGTALADHAHDGWLLMCTRGNSTDKR